MAIAFRNAAGSNSGSSATTTITMTVPSGVQDGDMMVMFVSCNGSNAPTTPSGWTSVSATNGTMVCWRLASSEPGSYLVTTPNDKSSGCIIAVSGSLTTAPTFATLKVNASSTTCTANAHGSWASANGIDVYYAGWKVGGDTLTGIAPTNYTNAGSSQSTGGSSGGRTQSVIAYRSLAAVTTVGSLTATDTTAAANTGGHVFIFENAPAETITADKWVPDTETPYPDKYGIVSYFRRLIHNLVFNDT